MPNIRDQSTVEAIAREFCGEGKRNKTRTMVKIGYDEGYADSGKGHRTVFGNIRVCAAIKAIDDAETAKNPLTIQSVLENIEWGIKKARDTNDLPALARLSELQGKYLSMWSEQGNNAAEGLSLNFTTRPPVGPTVVKLKKEA